MKYKSIKIETDMNTNIAKITIIYQIGFIDGVILIEGEGEEGEEE